MQTRRVLVTGGGDGLGRQFVTALVEAGADAVICGRREAPLEETREALTAAGGRVEVIVADVTNDDDRVRLARGDPDVVGEQPERREHLGRRRERVRQQQEAAHPVRIGGCPRC